MPCLRCQWFNPRPSSLTGELPDRRAVGILTACFNPRPSSLTGERITSNRLFFQRNLSSLREPRGKSAMDHIAHCAQFETFRANQLVVMSANR